MIECPSCHTLNPDGERECLACRAPLAAGSATRSDAAGASRCPAGHPIDPSWKTCPYCERTVASTGGAPPVRPTRLEAEPAADSDPRRTRLEGETATRPVSVSPEGPRPTRLEAAAVPAAHATVLAPPAAESGSRRLVAVLAAPDLGPGGAVFPVRSGKNTIGSDRASDVGLAGDAKVSREHALILVRDGVFHLADRLSTNGTWVNGQEVPANGTVTLQDRDRIRVGGTDLVFLAIDRQATDT